MDVVNAATGDNQDARNIATQVQKRVKFHGGFVATKLCPGEKRKGEIHDDRIQRKAT